MAEILTSETGQAQRSIPSQHQRRGFFPKSRRKSSGAGACRPPALAAEERATVRHQTRQAVECGLRAHWRGRGGGTQAAGGGRIGGDREARRPRGVRRVRRAEATPGGGAGGGWEGGGSEGTRDVIEANPSERAGEEPVDREGGGLRCGISTSLSQSRRARSRLGSLRGYRRRDTTRTAAIASFPGRSPGVCGVMAMANLTQPVPPPAVPGGIRQRPLGEVTPSDGSL